MSRALALAAAALCACTEPLELPVPPDPSPGEQAYDAPTAPLSVDTAEALLDGFLARSDQLSEIGELGPLIDTLIALDRKVTTTEDDDGRKTATIDDVPFTTDALIEITGDCPGWPDTGPAVDAFAMTVVVRASELIPVVWGDVADCRIEIARGDLAARVSVSADVIAYLPNLLDKELPRIIYLAAVITALSIDGRDSPLWEGDLRLVDDRLELRVDLADVGHVIAYATTGVSAVGVRAANGEWNCFRKERRCERTQPPASFSY